MREGYNKKFRQHYGIDFTKNYIVHHIDGDHSNDDISNLMLLPRGLHSQYHVLKRIIDNHALSTTITGNEVGAGNYYLQYYERFIAVLNECNKWRDYKSYLDGKLPNVHGIKLEE